MPEKLAELQQLWLEEARKYNVLPLDDRRIERFSAELVGRPELVKGNSQLLFGGMGRLSENSVLDSEDKSHAVTAEVVVPEAAPEHDRGAGRRLRRLEPVRESSASGLLLRHARPAAFRDRGRHHHAARTRQVRMEFAFDGRGLAKGGTVTLYLDGDKTREGRVEATVPLIFSADETADVGRNTTSPVSDDYDGENSVFPARSLGADRPRPGRRRRRPPDHARGTTARRDGAPVAKQPSPTRAVPRPVAGALQRWQSSPARRRAQR